MMASFLGKLGLIKWVSLTVGGGIDHLGIGWTGGMLLLVLFYVYSHYFLPAPPAHITAMFAAFYAAGLALGAPPMLLGLTRRFPPLADDVTDSLRHRHRPIIFGSGYTTLGEWWKPVW